MRERLNTYYTTDETDTRNKYYVNMTFFEVRVRTSIKASIRSTIIMVL